MRIFLWIIIMIVIFLGGAFFGANFQKNNNLSEKQEEKAVIVQEDIFGKWQSVDDKDYTADFSADGKLIEEYASSKIIDKGSWSITEKDGVTYLSKVFSDGKYDYTILELTPEKLVISFFPKGNTLTFVKIFDR